MLFHDFISHIVCGLLKSLCIITWKHYKISSCVGQMFGGKIESIFIFMKKVTYFNTIPLGSVIIIVD